MSTVDSKYRGSKIFILVYKELITAAQYRGTITYQEIAKLMGLPSSGSHMGREIGQLIGEISDDEAINNRPMLSAIVVGVSGEPGEGFYGLAKDLYDLELETRESKREFWHQEKAKVYQTWQTELE